MRYQPNLRCRLGAATSGGASRLPLSPTLGDALNAGYLYLEVRCLGCDTHQTVGAAPEDDADPRAGALHALQGLLRGAGLSVQAEPSGCAPAHQNFGA